MHYTKEKQSLPTITIFIEVGPNMFQIVIQSLLKQDIYTLIQTVR